MPTWTKFPLSPEHVELPGKLHRLEVSFIGYSAGLGFVRSKVGSLVSRCIGEMNVELKK